MFADYPDGMVLFYQLESILLIIGGLIEPAKDFCFEFHTEGCNLTVRDCIELHRYHCYMWFDPVGQAYASNRYYEWQSLPEPRPEYDRHIRRYMSRMGAPFLWDYCTVVIVFNAALHRAIEFHAEYYGPDCFVSLNEQIFLWNYHWHAWADSVYQCFTSRQYFRWQAIPEPRPYYDMDFNKISQGWGPANWHYHSINMLSDGVEIDILDWSLETYGRDIALSTQRSVDVRFFHYWAWLDPVHQAHSCWRYFQWQALPEPRIPYHSHIFENWFRFREITLLSVWLSDYHDFCNLWCVQSEYVIAFKEQSRLDARGIYAHPYDIESADYCLNFEEMFRYIRLCEIWPKRPLDVCFDLALQLRCNDESIEVRALRVRIDINNPQRGILEYKLQPDEGRSGFHRTMK